METVPSELVKLECVLWSKNHQICEAIMHYDAIFIRKKGNKEQYNITISHSMYPWTYSNGWAMDIMHE
jgi:hypothetical protein